jgi:hypothetical protein
MSGRRIVLTQSSLLGLLYRKRDGSEQFDKDLYDDLGHGGGGWDLCIDVEAPEEGLEGFEKVNKCIVARANIFDCLMDATCVIRILSSGAR